MIEISEINKSEPYSTFLSYYHQACKKMPNGVEAISIASFNNLTKEVDSRFVNLKYIIDNEWIFFSNYNSPKSIQFASHDQISALFYWEAINVQIRMKSIIKKTTEDFSHKHFNKRDKLKNALAISSSQSSCIDSYQEVINKFEKVLYEYSKETERPEYWGGFSFIPYSFEFWEANPSRINKRIFFEIDENEIWKKTYLEP